MTDTHEPLSIHLLRQLRTAVRHVNREHKAGLSTLERAALWITNHVGTMGLFLSNMIQIFLMPLIMVAQNLQARHSEARAEADFEIILRRLEAGQTSTS